MQPSNSVAGIFRSFLEFILMRIFNAVCETHAIEQTKNRNGEEKNYIAKRD